jgi:hypothetical protein
LRAWRDGGLREILSAGRQVAAGDSLMSLFSDAGAP